MGYQIMTIGILLIGAGLMTVVFGITIAIVLMMGDEE